ncbi:PucR family transcriptional regulator [Clostridium thailandense]|uniref:PucR family transcriptional regulator n=1 Tax=Clostridium thailandense TaxID=2794346 RepID=UPI003988F7EB
MNMYINEIMDNINQFEPESYIFKQDSTYISTIEAFNKDQKLFQSDILYIGNFSDILHISYQYLPINVLCIVDTPIPPEYLKHLKTNLIVLNKDVDIIIVLKELEKSFSFHQYYIQSSLKLMEALLSGKNIQYILNIGTEIFGNPLLIGDSSFKTLGYTYDIPIDDPWWNEQIEANYVSSSSMMVLQNSKEFNRCLKSTEPELVDNKRLSKYRYIVNNIMVDGKRLGHFCVIEYKRQFQQSDNRLIKLICDILASVMQRNSSLYCSKGEKYEYFIANLLDGKEQDHEPIQKRLKYMDLYLKENLYVITIHNIGENDRYELLPYMIEVLESLISGVKSIIYHNNVVMIFSCDSRETLNKGILKKLSDFLKKQHMVAGISQCFNDITNIREHYLQSINSIELGMKMNDKKTIYIYNDYSVYDLLNIAAEHRNLKSFCNPAFFKLINYDDKNNTNYVESLLVYLSNGTNVRSAAHALNIHRNTMDYRINKIQEIMDLKFSDPDVILSLYLSYKIFNIGII